MKKLLVIVTFLVVNQLAFAQIDQQEKPKISALGMGTVTAFPNAAQITISLKHIKPILREAVNENQKTANDVQKIIKNYVLDTLLIKTSLISTNKITRWDDKLNKDVFVGFESTQKIIFTLNDLKRMQDFTEELLKTRFNKIERVSYFNTEAHEYIKKAQELAVLDAIETTKRLAKVAEIKMGNIIYMQSNKSPNETVNRSESYEFESYGKGMGGKGVSSSGELIKYSVSVTIFSEILE